MIPSDRTRERRRLGHGWFTVAIAALLAAVAIGLFGRQPETDPAAASSASAVADRAATDATTAALDHGEDRSPPARDLAAIAAEVVLRVRLCGLVPAATWTVPVAIRCKGKHADEWREHEARAPPDAGGTILFPLPAWANLAEHFELRVTAEDPNYAPVDERRGPQLQHRGELAVDVQALATLRGRFVDEQQRPVPAAAVTAFVADPASQPSMPLASTTTAADGTFVLQAPAACDLLLVGQAMHAASFSGRQLVGRHGAIATVEQPRADLLPATLRARGTLGAPAALPDLVLPPALQLRGQLRWPDGRPAAGARIFVSDRMPGRNIANRYLVVADGRVSPSGSVTAADDGSFAFGSLAGASLDLVVSELPQVVALASPRLRAAAPGDVVWTLPAPATVRVQRAGDPVPDATVCFGTGGRTRADEQGEARFLITEGEVAVRAVAGGRSSPTVTLAPAVAGTTTLLELDRDDGVEIAIELRAAAPIRQAQFVWEALPAGTRSYWLLQRGDGSGPFRMRLPPGRYRLRVESARGERNGHYLLPVATEVVLPTPLQPLELDAAFGGRLTLGVIDARGVPMAGTVQLRDASGQAVDCRFAVRLLDGTGMRGGPGAFFAVADNECLTLLAPGDYTASFELGVHGRHERRVTIAPRETTKLLLRL